MPPKASISTRPASRRRERPAAAGGAGASGASWMTRVLMVVRIGRESPTVAAAAAGRQPGNFSLGGRFSGVLATRGPSGAQEQQHGEDASRLAARRRQPELAEDARDVLLDRAQRDREGVGDALVGTAGRH